MKKIAILASGSGSNAVGLASLFNEGNRVRVSLVLSDRENAPVLESMSALVVDARHPPREMWSEAPDAVLSVLKDREIDIVVVDGFGPLLPRQLIDAYPNAFLSVFPSLTPADSAGVRDIVEVQREVIAEGDELAGSVVCRVEDPDSTGTVLFKETCPAGSDPVELAARVAEMSKSLLPRAVVALIRGNAAPAMPPAVPHVNEALPPEVPSSDEVPPVPPVSPSADVDRQWAEALKVKYDPERVVPPAIPGQPVASGSASGGNGSAPGENDDRPPMPPSYIVWAVLSTVLCCFIPGIVAIIYSSQVTSRYYNGDYEGARRSSRNAEIWIIISFVLGVLSSTLYLPFMMLV